MTKEELIKSTLNVCRREFERIIERKTLYLLSIFLPVGIFILFCLIYSNGIVTQIPIAIFDEDNSDITRLAIRQFASTPTMKIYKYVNSLSDLEKEFRQGNIQGAIYFPKNTEKNVRKQKPASCVIYRASSNLIIGNTLLRDALSVSKSLSGKILMTKIEKSKGVKEFEAKKIVQPIIIDSSSMFNPYYSYLFFLVPGVITVTLYMIVLVISVLLISSELSHNTFANLVSTANSSIFAIITGKILPHLLINFSTCLLIIGIIFPIFGIPIYGSYFQILLFMAVFVLTTILVGFAISTIYPDQQKATETGMMLATPAFVFSGFTYPLWAAPQIHQIISDIFPFTHFLKGFIKLYQMNTHVKYVMPEYFAFFVFSVVSVAIIFFTLKKRIKNTLKDGEL